MGQPAEIARLAVPLGRQELEAKFPYLRRQISDAEARENALRGWMLEP
jgi:hypothetical protein